MNAEANHRAYIQVAPDQLVSFRASILAPELGQRVNRDRKTLGSTAKADLSRYYVLLKIGRDSIAGRFSSNEMNLIAGGVYEERRPELFDLGWWDYDAARMQKALLIAKIEDAVRKYPLQRTYEADPGALLEKIESMNALQVAALVDTIERYWSLRPKAGGRGFAEAYEALDFITSDRVSLTRLPPKDKPNGASIPMPDNRRKTLVDTFREYAADPNFLTWEDHEHDLLHFKTTVDGKRRHVTFGDVTRHSLEALDDQQRADAIAGLFSNSATWPAGTADVRYVSDGVIMSKMMSQTDIYVFVGDIAVSPGVRISTPMIAS